MKELDVLFGSVDGGQEILVLQTDVDRLTARLESIKGGATTTSKVPLLPQLHDSGPLRERARVTLRGRRC